MEKCEQVTSVEIYDEGMEELIERNERLYFRYVPSDDSRAGLALVQAEIAGHASQCQLSSPESWHLTLLHLGRPRDLFAEVATASPALHPEEYVVQLQRLLEAIDEAASPVTTLKVRGLEPFGVRGTALALAFEPGELRLDHSLALRELVTFLQRCRVEDPELFIERSSNLHRSLQFRPHVTLARGVQPGIVGKTPPPTTMGFWYGGV